MHDHFRMCCLYLDGIEEYHAAVAVLVSGIYLWCVLLG